MLQPVASFFVQNISMKRVALGKFGDFEGGIVRVLTPFKDPTRSQVAKFCKNTMLIYYSLYAQNPPCGFCCLEAFLPWGFFLCNSMYSQQTAAGSCPVSDLTAERGEANPVHY